MSQYPSTKQQILYYILRTTLLYRRDPLPSEICQQSSKTDSRQQDQPNLHSTALPPTDTRVSETTETNDFIIEISDDQISLEKDFIFTSSSMEGGITKITEDVYLSPKFLYLIKIDGEEFGFSDDEKTAHSIINSVANDYVVKLDRPGTKVFRRDLKKGAEIHICTQKIGTLYNGSVIKDTIITIVPVPRTFIIRTEVE